MSLFKNPIMISLLTTFVVFVVLFYYYNYYSIKTDKKDKNKKNKKKQKKSYIINETMIISSVLCGLISWFIVTNYIYPEQKDIINNIGNNINMSVSNDMDDIEGLIDTKKKYNVINSGVIVPNKDIDIPDVLIDFKM